MIFDRKNVKDRKSHVGESKSNASRVTLSRGNRVSITKETTKEQKKKNTTRTREIPKKGAGKKAKNREKEKIRTIPSPSCKNVKTTEQKKKKIK